MLKISGCFGLFPAISSQFSVDNLVSSNSTKFDFNDPTEGAYSSPQTSQLEFRGFISTVKRNGERKKEGKGGQKR